MHLKIKLINFYNFCVFLLGDEIKEAYFLGFFF